MLGRDRKYNIALCLDGAASLSTASRESHHLKSSFSLLAFSFPLVVKDRQIICVLHKTALLNVKNTSKSANTKAYAIPRATFSKRSELDPKFVLGITSTCSITSKQRRQNLHIQVKPDCACKRALHPSVSSAGRENSTSCAYLLQKKDQAWRIIASETEAHILFFL